jgi:hypothetical protein
MTDTPDPMSSMGDQAHIVKGIIQRAPHSRLPKPPNGSEVDNRSLRCARPTCVDELSG